MKRKRELFVMRGTGLRKSYSALGYKGSVNEYLESIKKYEDNFIQVFERQEGQLVLLWSKDKKGVLQQVDQMELF